MADDREIIGLTPQAYQELINEIRALKQQVGASAGDYAPAHGVDFPYPGLAIENIAAGESGLVTRRVRTGATWGVSSEGPRTVHCFAAVNNGQYVTVNRDPSKGALFAVPGGASSFESCFCELLKLVWKLAELNDNLDDVYEDGATELDPDVTVSDQIAEIAECAGCGVACGDCTLPLTLYFSLESVDDIEGLDYFGGTDCYDFEASALNNLAIAVPNDGTYLGTRWTTEYDVSHLVTPYVRFGTPDDGLYDDFRLYVDIRCTGEGTYLLQVQLKMYNDVGGLVFTFPLTPTYDDANFEGVPIDAETCESEDNTTTWQYSRFNDAIGNYEFETQSTRFNVKNES